jgi:hypothetical protein
MPFALYLKSLKENYNVKAVERFNNYITLLA